MRGAADVDCAHGCSELRFQGLHAAGRRLDRRPPLSVCRPAIPPVGLACVSRSSRALCRAPTEPVRVTARCAGQNCWHFRLHSVPLPQTSRSFGTSTARSSGAQEVRSRTQQPDLAIGRALLVPMSSARLAAKCRPCCASSNRIAISASWMVPVSHRTRCRPKP
jgi:hypothetical protein